jgi:hypothetical protein
MKPSQRELFLAGACYFASILDEGRDDPLTEAKLRHFEKFDLDEALEHFLSGAIGRPKAIQGDKS